MKQGTVITRMVVFLLFIGAVLYMGVYAVRRLSDPMTTALAYWDTLNDTAEVTGFVVRTEMMLTGGGAIMDVLPEEGERVGAGHTVAVLYQNSEALARKTELDMLELEREQLQYALNSGSDMGDAANLEGQVVSALLNLRAGCAAGDLSDLDGEALALRTRVLQRDFAYSGTADSAAALQSAIGELDGRIAALRAQAVYDTTSVSAPCSGLFSGQVDGYETVLTPELLDTLTAAQLSALPARTSPPDGAVVGKLITGSRWYFTCILDQASAARLQKGDLVTVSFSRGFSADVTMRVERVGGAEPEGCVVVLSSTRRLKDVTLLRRQTADLIFERHEGIRVPKQALRVVSRTAVDTQTGEEYADQQAGVYTVVGAKAEFKCVDIVQEGSDYYLVRPSAGASGPLLRAGDEVIVSASDLYDGKVILE